MTPEEWADRIARALVRNTHHVVAAIYDGEEVESIIAYQVGLIVAEMRERCARLVEEMIVKDDNATPREQIAAAIRGLT
jgi:hypothetical protein